GPPASEAARLPTTARRSPLPALSRTGRSGAHTFAGFPPGNLLAVRLGFAGAGSSAQSGEQTRGPVAEAGEQPGPSAGITAAHQPVPRPPATPVPPRGWEGREWGSGRLRTAARRR